MDGSRRNRIAGYGLESFVSGQGREAVSWEDGNELLVSMNCGEYLDRLRNWRVLSCDFIY